MIVDTIIIGAGRSGTTTLCKMIENHAQVCFSKIKEVHYFSIEDLNKRGPTYYHSFFPHLRNEKISASADTYLLMDYDAIERIKAYNPQIKIVVMLRDPVERAYSSYNYSINYGYHDAYDSFLDSIKEEENIEDESSIVQRNNVGHFYGSLYAKHLREWVKKFSKEQILILTTKELKDDLNGVESKIATFLDIKPFDEQNQSSTNRNPNAVPKFRAFEQFLLNRENPIRKFIRWGTPSFLKKLIINSNVVDKIHDLNRKPSTYKPLNELTRLKAMKYFEKDIEALNNEFGIEL